MSYERQERGIGRTYMEGSRPFSIFHHLPPILFAARSGTSTSTTRTSLQAGAGAGALLTAYVVFTQSARSGCVLCFGAFGWSLFCVLCIVYWHGVSSNIHLTVGHEKQQQKRSVVGWVGQS
jgi:hypothetical protein